MEKRALLAVVLSIIVLGLWQVLVAPPPKAPPAAGARAEKAPAPEGGAAAGGEAAAEPTEESEEPPPPPETASEPVAAEKQKEFIVETKTDSVRFDNAGGKIVSWRMLAYLDDLKAPRELIPRDIAPGGEFPLRLSVPGDDDATAALDAALYQDEVRDATPDDEWPGNGFRGKIVSFTWANAQGLAAEKRLALSEDGYLGAVEADVTRNGQPVKFRLTWAVGLPEPHDGKTTLYWRARNQGIIRVGGAVQRLKPASLKHEEQFTASPGTGTIQWAGVESTYFASVLLPEDPNSATVSFVPVATTGKDGGQEKKPEPVVAARFDGKGPMQFSTLVGPKDYDLLVKAGRGLELSIDFSRFAILYALTKYLFLALRAVNGYVGNYGFSIILLTIFLRLFFFPLTYRSSISMRQNQKKMQKIQPRVKAIQERYKKQKRTMESQRKMNDEVMAVYKKEGMNPMGSLGGCLPLFIQMPFFLAFYYLLSVTIEMRGAPFILWVHDLSRMDPYYVLPILMGVSWMLQQSLTSSSIADPTQRRIMGLMPLIFTWMMKSMPSGLVLYWLVSNLLGLVQQYMINRKADRMSAQA